MIIQPVSEHTLVVRFGDDICESTNRTVSRFHRLASARLAEVVIEMTPSYTTLLCRYDHLRVDFRWMQRELHRLHNTLDSDTEASESGTIVDIPVWYDPEVGYDLEQMARDKGLDETVLIERHTSPIYRVYAIGFIPGFPFMGRVDESLVTPRRSTPRQRVAAGSVGIADYQTSVYPIQSPGGWNIIGRSPTELFSPEVESGDVSLLKVGDQVRFVSIDRETFLELGGTL